MRAARRGAGFADFASLRMCAGLAEMVRVTRPGGRILVWDHNPLNRYWPLLMRRVPQDNGSERLVPMAELTAGLEGVGATVLRAERLGFMPEFVPRRLLVWPRWPSGRRRRLLKCGISARTMWYLRSRT